MSITRWVVVVAGSDGVGDCVKLAVTGSDHLADGAHVVAVDPTTRHSYFPVPAGTNGRPALLERQPVS